MKIPKLLKEYCTDFTPEYSEEKLLAFIKGHLTAAQRKSLDAIQLDPNFEIEWIQSWSPSPKFLVGAV